MKTITGHKVTVTEAYMMSEQGAGYSLSPWHGDSRYYQGYSEEVEIEIPDDWHIGKSAYGERLLFQDGAISGVTLEEAMALGIAKVRGG